jgi:adenylosuccinate lyase
MEKQDFEMYALCPLDGRYSGIAKKFAPHFSEFALNKERTFVEVEWLKFLIKNIKNPILNKFGKHSAADLDKINTGFDEKSFTRIKEIENITKHDVNAVVQFVGLELDKMGYGELKSFVHIGATSEDINNTAYARMLKQSVNNVWLPDAGKMFDKVYSLSLENKDLPMLAHTHGQPATPTTVGKEFLVFAQRMANILKQIKAQKYFGKFNGATGNYAAIDAALPNNDWQMLCKKFVTENLELDFNPITTQIENQDYISEIADKIRHFNNVTQGLDLDMWTYISKDYFKQIPVKDEVGSSTMPHKVNPINFENSEGNVDISNALCTAISNKMPKSRMQRDLSNSTVLRNLGLMIGYSDQAICETVRGLNKVAVNREKLAGELDNNWAVLAEALQQVLRANGNAKAYDILKDLTRGKQIDENAIKEFITRIADNLPPETKRSVQALTPKSYIGLANKIELQK